MFKKKIIFFVKENNIIIGGKNYQIHVTDSFFFC